MKLLQGILRISRQEGEWFLYFYSLGEMLLLAAECYNSPVMVKCAEVYYRDIDSHGGKEVFYHAGKDESWINAWICSNIFHVYTGCHQIGDAGMNAFMEKYEAITSLYGESGITTKGKWILDCCIGTKIWRNMVKNILRNMRTGRIVIFVRGDRMRNII